MDYYIIVILTLSLVIIFSMFYSCINRKLRNNTNEKIKKIEKFEIIFDQNPKFMIQYSSYDNVLLINYKINIYDKNKNLIKAYEDSIKQEGSTAIKERRGNNNIYMYFTYIYLHDIDIFDDNVAYYSLEGDFSEHTKNIKSNSVLKDNIRIYSKYYYYSKSPKDTSEKEGYVINKVIYNDKDINIKKVDEDYNISINDKNKYVYMLLQGYNTYTLPFYYCDLYKDNKLVKTIKGDSKRSKELGFNEFIEYKFHTRLVDFDEYEIYSNKSENPQIDLTQKEYRYIKDKKELYVRESMIYSSLMMIKSIHFSNDNNKNSMILIIKGSAENKHLPNYKCSIYDESENLINEYINKSFISLDENNNPQICAYFDFEESDFTYFSLNSDYKSYPNMNISLVNNYNDIDLYNTNVWEDDVYSSVNIVYENSPIYY